MRAGALRHFITIQETVSTADALGTKVKSWATFARVHAEKDPKQGREFFSSNKVQGEIATIWRIRYLAGITEKMRILSPEGDPFDISGPPTDVKGRYRELLIPSVAGVRDGRN